MMDNNRLIDNMSDDDKRYIILPVLCLIGTAGLSVYTSWVLITSQMASNSREVVWGEISLVVLLLGVTFSIVWIYSIIKEARRSQKRREEDCLKGLTH